MSLMIPEELLRAAQMSAEEFRRARALWLYQQRRLTLAQETLGTEGGCLWYNPAMPTVLEGLWEEIVAQSDALEGKRVRVEVLEPAPTEKTPANPLDALVGLIPAEEGSGEASLSVHHDEYLYPRR